MKKIPLTKGHFATVDDEDFETLSKLKWHAIIRGRLMHARHWKNKVYMHRHVMDVTDPKIFVDHINGDGLDNRRCNLRICSRMENGYNRGVPKHNKTGFKGVTLAACGKGEKWMAHITAQKRTLWLGAFSTPEEAARAYDEAARRLHGEFARTNF